jgi:hypothetical protein
MHFSDIQFCKVHIYDIPLSFKILWMRFIQAEILQFYFFLTYNSLYAIVDNFDCFPCISLHQYEINLISISSGYLPNSPYTIKLGVDTFRRI